VRGTQLRAGENLQARARGAYFRVTLGSLKDFTRWRRKRVDAQRRVDAVIKVDPNDAVSAIKYKANTIKPTRLICLLSVEKITPRSWVCGTCRGPI
jgi:hypothetical protein